jgi:hypothetical protein
MTRPAEYWVTLDTSASELRNRNAGGSFLVLPVAAAAADEVIE